MRAGKTILDESWRPALARYLYPSLSGPRSEPKTYLGSYDCDRVHYGRLTRGGIPAYTIHGARKMEAR